MLFPNPIIFRNVLTRQPHVASVTSHYFYQSRKSHQEADWVAYLAWMRRTKSSNILCQLYGAERSTFIL